MEFNTCPKCKSQAKRKWLKAFCNVCNMELAESDVTRTILFAVPIIGMFTIMLIGQSGTVTILAQDPADLKGVLFKYYMTLLIIMWFVTGGINYVVRNYFSVYK